MVHHLFSSLLFGAIGLRSERKSLSSSTAGGDKAIVYQRAGNKRNRLSRDSGSKEAKVKVRAFPSTNSGHGTRTALVTIAVDDADKCESASGAGPAECSSESHSLAALTEGAGAVSTTVCRDASPRQASPAPRSDRQQQDPGLGGAAG